jgi:hypothetical protein
VSYYSVVMLIPEGQFLLAMFSFCLAFFNLGSSSSAVRWDHRVAALKMVNTMGIPLVHRTAGSPQQHCLHGRICGRLCHCERPGHGEGLALAGRGFGGRAGRPHGVIQRSGGGRSGGGAVQHDGCDERAHACRVISVRVCSVCGERTAQRYANRAYVRR